MAERACRLFSHEEQTWGNRNIPLQKDAENNTNWTYEKREVLRKRKVKTGRLSLESLKDIFYISRMHNKEIRFGKFDTHRAY